MPGIAGAERQEPIRHRASGSDTGPPDNFDDHRFRVKENIDQFR